MDLPGVAWSKLEVWEGSALAGVWLLTGGPQLSLNLGDALMLADESELRLTAETDAELLLFDLPAV